MGDLKFGVYLGLDKKGFCGGGWDLVNDKEKQGLRMQGSINRQFKTETK